MLRIEGVNILLHEWVNGGSKPPASMESPWQRVTKGSKWTKPLQWLSSPGLYSKAAPCSISQIFRTIILCWNCTWEIFLKKLSDIRCIAHQRSCCWVIIMKKFLPIVIGLGISVYSFNYRPWRPRVTHTGTHTHRDMHIHTGIRTLSQRPSLQVGWRGALWIGFASVSVCGRERVVFIKLLSVCQVFPTECDFFSNWNVKGHSWVPRGPGQSCS